MLKKKLQRSGLPYEVRAALNTLRDKIIDGDQNVFAELDEIAASVCDKGVPLHAAGDWIASFLKSY